MALKGDLKDINLADIFQTLAMNQQEGTLTVVSGNRRMDLYFSREGVHLLTSADKDYPRLGEILLKEKKITPVELDMALARQKMTGELIGQALIDMGIVSTDDIEQCVRRQIEEEIYDVFSWENARFEFVPGEPKGEFFDPAKLGKPITFDVSGIIMEAARRVDEWELIHKIVPSMQSVLKIKNPDAPLPSLGETEVTEEVVEKIAELIDGKRTVEKIVAKSPAGKFETSKVLALLVQKQFAEVLGVKEMIFVADSYANEGDVDTAIKIYKESLKNLPPSSIFRQKLAQFYESIDRPKEAAAEYAALADAFMEEGSDEDALSLYQKAVELAPKNFSLHRKLFEFYFSNGMNEEAVEEGLFVSRNYWRINKLQEAKDVLDKLSEIAPDNLEVRQMLINISLDLEDTDGALEHYESLAEHYAKVGDRKNLIEIYRKMLAIDKSRSDIRAKLDRELGRSVDIEKRKKKGRRTLVVGVVVLIVVGGLASAFWYYNHLARTDMEKTKTDLEKFAEQKAEAISTKDADRLERDFNELKKEFERLLKQYKYAFFTNLDEWKSECEELLDRCRRIVDDVTARRKAELERVQQEIASLLDKAEELDEGGNKSKAIKIYEQILNRADTNPDSIKPSLRIIVQQKVAELKQYLADAKFLFDEAVEAENDRAFKKAFQKLKELLKKYPDSPEAKRVMLPLVVETVPSGAKVWLDGVLQDGVTPLVLKRRPNALVKVTFRYYGCKDVTLRVSDEQLEVHVRLQKVPVWKTALRDIMVLSPLTTDGRRVFITNVSGGITALDAADGKVLWKYKPEEFGHFKSNAVSTGKFLVVGSLNNMLYIIDREEGKTYWKSKLKGLVTQPVLAVNEIVFVSVEDAAGAGGTLILKCDLNQKRKEDFRSFAQRQSVPLLFDEKEQAIIACTGRDVTAFDTQGRRLWSYTLSQKVGSRMALVGEFIVLPTERGSLVRLRRARDLPKVPSGEEGEKCVSRELSPIVLGSVITTGVCVAGNMAFVCTYAETTQESFIHAVDVMSGTELWRQKLEKRVDATPVTDKKRVFVVDSRGKIYAFGADTAGKLLWQDAVNEEVMAAPVIVGRFLVVVTKGGDKPAQVYAYVR